MLFPGKKGDTGFEQGMKLLFSILVAVAFVAALLYAMNVLTSDDSVIMDFMARDTAMLLDAMHTGQGEMEITYVMDDEYRGEYDFTFSRGWTKVESSENLSQRFPFAIDSRIPAFSDNETVESAEEISFYRNESGVGTG